MATPQSFCKMFFGDFSPNNMMIPSEFAKKHTELVIPQICRLETESARYSWIVKVQKMGDDLYVTDGWSQFVTDNDICATDFLVFRLVGESMFEVEVYRSNGCLKEPLSPNPSSSQRHGKAVGGPSGIKSTFDTVPSNNDHTPGMPSFYKVLFNDDYDHTFRLPVAFASKYGERLSKRSKVVAGSGETWNVKLEVVNENYCFTRGWDLFVKDFKLGYWEYLVFGCDVGKSEFHVSVYGVCSCERDLPTNNQPMMDECEEDEYGNASPSSEEEHPHFRVCLKKHQISRLPLPKRFVEAAGLMNEYTVLLQYPPNELYWSVLMGRISLTRDGSDQHYYRFELRKGWSKFRKVNGLVFGETYLFEYVADKRAIQVRPVQGEEN